MSLTLWNQNLKFGIPFIWLMTLALNPLVGQESKSGIDTRGVDRTVRVQDDLFRYVNGEWLKHTPIPEDKSNYGSFTVLADEAQAHILAIIEKTSATKHPQGSIEQQVGDFYASYMNEDLIEKRGIDGLREELAKIDRLTSKPELLAHWGYLQTIGVGGPIGLYVDQDDKKSSEYLAVVMQSGTTLPDRDYYLEADERYVQARKALQAYIQELFHLSGLGDEANAAKVILELETQLAQVQWEKTELRDAEKRYNKYLVENLGQLTGDLDWKAFFAAAEVPTLSEVNVATPSFFEGLAKIIDQTPLESWKAYLRFGLIDAYATVLPKTYVDAHFLLHDQVLAGVPQQEPRWKRAVDATAGTRGFGVLGDAVGQLYVREHFDEQAKLRMDQLVKNLLKSFEMSVAELTWMTPTTKQKAAEKLAKITTKIGYTEKWRDYSRLEIRPDDLLGNVLRSAKIEHDRIIAKLGRPVDRMEWGMTPQTVNAYYNPSMNEIVFPAAILQPPFFDPTADDAANYGGIGAVIGHEISHAFDDQGSKYDGDGNLNNWWTEQDRAAFQQLTEKLVSQYVSYEALPGKQVDGKLTLGENIADLSGLAIALKAYQISLAGQPAPELDGWSGVQRFFLGWGQVWRRKYRDEEMVRRLLTDPHSPSEFRANGPLTNIQAFYEAFQIQPTDRLFRPKAERIRIW